jgi:hypothetical protein
VLFYLFLITLLTTLVCALVLWYMIKKFYWGPTGRPPRYRYREEWARGGGRRATLSKESGRD